MLARNKMLQTTAQQQALNDAGTVPVGTAPVSDSGRRDHAREVRVMAVNTSENARR